MVVVHTQQLCTLIAAMYESLTLDSEIFLEKVVHDLLSSLLSLYCREAGELDFSSPVPGLASFADL